jgi:cytochrome c peroxidase
MTSRCESPMSISMRAKGGIPLSIALASALGALMACGANPLSGGEDGFSGEEWDRVLELEPLSVPLGESPFNEYADDPDAASFGHQLFFEKAFASAVRVEGPSGAVGETGMVACTNCHDPEGYFSDTRRTGGMSHGVAFTTRNSPSLVNVAYYSWFNWGGRADTLASQGGGTLETSTNAGSSRLLVSHVVYAKYKAEYEGIFGALDPALDPEAPDAARFPPSGRPKASADAPDGPWEMMADADRQAINLIMANIGKSFEAYERRLISGSSPFSRYIEDPDANPLPAAARRGLGLFIGKGACNECHTGPVLSDDRFHNTGVAQAVGEHTPAVDEGRFEDVPPMLRSQFNSAGRYSANPELGAQKLASANPEDTSTKGQFRTKSLLNVAETGPYFHNGSASTLEEVVEHYNIGGAEPGSYAGTIDPKVRPLRLSGAEVADLVAFLQSLTGEPVPEEWRRDPSAP